MKKRVLLFSRDPGGANAILPLIGEIKRRNCKVLLYGKDIALKRYAAEKMKGFDITKKVKDITVNGLAEFLKQERPDVIITGTSADDMTEKYLWAASKKLKIYSMAIVDQWVNYGVRFSRYKINELNSYNKRKEHEYLPDKILVPDNQARKEMIDEGIEKKAIIVSGNPYFEDLFNKVKKINNKRLLKFKKNHRINLGDFMVVFASEPVSKMYGGSGYLGYTEKTILKEIVDGLLNVQQDSDKNLVLIIRPHPKDGSDHYRDFIGKYGNKLRIVVDSSLKGFELISIADLVCGMYSMFLIEAIVLEKPILSVQIGLKREDPFVLDRLGKCSPVLNHEQLIREFRSAVRGKKNMVVMKIENEPIKKVVDQMERILCQN